MKRANEFPIEIWVRVLRYIESPTDLLQCRLVCKKWDYPAETVMFSKRLEISDEEELTSLCNHLSKPPSRTHLVRDLDVDGCHRNPTQVIKLIKLALNPNMENLRFGVGDEVDGIVISTMLKIIAGFPNDTVWKLNSIPESTIQHDDNYTKLAYILRDNLISLHISASFRPMNTYLEKLAPFKNLRQLRLNAEDLTSVVELDSILKNCPRLRELTLLSPMNHYIEQDRDSLVTWMDANVQKVKRMTTLVITELHTDLIEYLSYKYPDIFCVEFLHYRYLYEDDQATRVLTALKHNPMVRIHYSFDEPQDLISSIPTVFGIHQDYAVDAKIYYDIEAGMRFTRSAIDKLIHCTIQLGDGQSTELHREILDQLEAQTGNCDLLYLNVSLLYPQAPPNENLLTFYQIMTKFPGMKQLRIQLNQIKYEPTEVQGALEKLVIQHANIDANVLPQISKSFPKLRFLELSNCSIIDHENHQDNVYNINLTYSYLCELTLRIRGRAQRTHVTSIAGDCYFKVSVVEAGVETFHRLKGSVFPLTRAEFDARPRKQEDATIYITCGAVQNLLIQLGEMQHTIDVNSRIIERIQMVSEEVSSQIKSLAENPMPPIHILLQALNTLTGKVNTLDSFTKKLKALDQEKREFINNDLYEPYK